MKLHAKLLHRILIACIALAIIASVASVWYATGWLSTRAETLVEVRLEQIGLEEQQKRAFEASNALDEYGELSEIVKQVAPTEKEQEKIIAELYKIADENNIAIQSLAFDSSNLGEEKTNTPTPAQTPVAQGGEAQDGAEDSSATPATTATVRNTITQTVKIDGLKNVVGLNIRPEGFTQLIKDGNGNVVGTRESGLEYSTILNFLESLERNRRQMIIDQISITPIQGEDGQIAGYTLTLALTALIAT
jgi:hypothetical protein